MNLYLWQKHNLKVAWTARNPDKEAEFALILIHGFGACKEHWRNNQNILGSKNPCYAVDLIGFGESSQPTARLNGDNINAENFSYNFDNWAEQIVDFSKDVVKKPVILIGNSIGGIVALRAGKLLKNTCTGIILINCAQRTMDDKRLKSMSLSTQLFRPLLKQLVRKRSISKILFNYSAKKSIIKKILLQAYPSRENVNDELVDILYTPTQRRNAVEAFHGFINIFNDHLAPTLMNQLSIPIHLIWGSKDPWEPLKEAQSWKSKIRCIKSLNIIEGAGHCPHDEKPKEVNNILLNLIQHAI